MVVSVLPLKQISPLAPTATLNTDPLCVGVDVRKEEEEEESKRNHFYVDLGSNQIGFLPVASERVHWFNIHNSRSVT